MHTILEKDFEEIIASELPLEQFREKVILVTGATGLIGSLLVKFLLFCNQKKKLNLSILVAVRNIKKAEALLGKDETLQFIQWDMTSDKPNYSGTVDYIVHTAAITNSKIMVTNPVETIRTSLHGTETVLELAREKRAAMVYISSMEIYGNPNLPHMVSEEDYGYLDLSSARSSYPESKRMCECLCTAYVVEYGVRVCTARLAQTFGAGILPGENRVFAQFARSVMTGSDIVLHTLGQSEGNYVYTADVIRALLLLLVKGEAGQAYNVVNEENHMTIAQMAEMVVRCFGNANTKVVIDIPENSMQYGYAPQTKMHLSSKKLENLGWHAQVGLKESYRRMIKYIQEIEVNNSILKHSCKL